MDKMGLSLPSNGKSETAAPATLQRPGSTTASLSSCYTQRADEDENPCTFPQKAGVWGEESEMMMFVITISIRERQALICYHNKLRSLQRLLNHHSVGNLLSLESTSHSILNHFWLSLEACAIFKEQYWYEWPSTRFQGLFFALRLTFSSRWKLQVCYLLDPWR